MAKTVEEYQEEEMIINQGNPWGDNDPNDLELAGLYSYEEGQK